MRSYVSYGLLLALLLISIATTWGETNKTIMYSIAIASLIGLVTLKAVGNRTDKR